jgi:hypothetical protein
MLLIIALIALVWVFAMVLVWAVCAASATGDKALGYEPSRHEVPEPAAEPEPQASPAADSAPALARVRFSG